MCSALFWYFRFLDNTSRLLNFGILGKTFRFPAGDQVLLACPLARGGVQGEEAEGDGLPVGRMHDQVQQDFQGRNDHDQIRNDSKTWNVNFKKMLYKK